MSSLRIPARRASPTVLSASAHGRSPAYRRLFSAPAHLPTHRQHALPLASLLAPTAPAAQRSLLSSPMASPFSSAAAAELRLRWPAQRQLRAFHASSLRWQQKQQQSSSPQQQTPEKSESEAKQTKKDDSAGEKEKEAEPEGQEKQKKEDADKDGGKKNKEEEELPPPPPHGDKTPWQVFLDTMQSEFKQSKEWNDSTKALAEGAHQFTESESVQRARKAYDATTGAVSSTASTVIKTTATAVGKGASWTWETPVMKGVRKGANATGEVLDKATKPIRETEAFKNVKDVIDDGSSSRYGGWVEKEERRKRREKWQLQNGVSGGAPEVMEENPNAGTNITIHKDAAWKEAWRDFKDSSKVVQGFFTMKDVYNESENPLISTARSITDRFAGFFAENETAMVIKKLRQMDPSFQLEPFLRELREYILPEVLDAYVKGDVETLKLWLSEAQYSVYEALTKQYMQAGLKSDGRILDIRHVDILKARMLEPGEIPVFIITCRTQEVHVYRKVKSGDLAAGMEDKVQLVTYAIGITRVPEDVSNPETRGWRLIEMQKSGRDYI